MPTDPTVPDDLRERAVEAAARALCHCIRTANRSTPWFCTTHNRPTVDFGSTANFCSSGRDAARAALAAAEPIWKQGDPK